MSQTYPDRIVLVFPIAAKSRPAAASLQTLTVLESGREIEDVVPLDLDLDAVSDYAEQFSLDLLAERDSLQAQLTEAQAEIERLTALVPPPIPDALANADWQQFRSRVLADPAVQRVAAGNSTAWPLLVLYLAELALKPSRAADIANLWTLMESNTPVQPDEVDRINAIAADCGVPITMNADGSIG